jgi:hypothetical protein
LANPWNNGLVEKWNNEHTDRMILRFYFPMKAIKITVALRNQTQHSFIPLLQYPIVLIYEETGGNLVKIR